MTESRLVRPEAAPSRPRRRRPWLIIAALVLSAVAVAAAWWLLIGRGINPEWDRIAQLDLAAPAGDAFLAETPWVRLQIAPAAPGRTNTLRVSLEAPLGTPVSGNSAPRIASLTAQSLASGQAAEPLPLTPDEGGALVATSALDRGGWWRLSVAVEGDGAGEPAAFYLMLPDPNVNGPGAAAGSGSTSEGEALFQRAIGTIAALRSVRYEQWIADGNGNASVSAHAVRAGGDGTPPAFSYAAAGGMDAVVIGTTRWVRFPAVPEWQRQEGAIVVPPAEWGEEYAGATGFSIIGEETVDGERCQILALVLPELTEPRTRSMARYLWWVGTETGNLRREAMVSRQHYMLNRFTGFDQPLEIVPPAMPATPPAGTPVS